MTTVEATATGARLLTAGDLLRLSSQGVRGELIMGVLHETAPAGLRQGRIAVRLIARLGEFVEPRGLGTVVGTDSGVLLDREPDTVREPDVAFFSADTLPSTPTSPATRMSSPASWRRSAPPATRCARSTTRRGCG